MSFFTETKVLSILDNKLPAVNVEKSTTVQEALKILYETGFSSLPVSDPNIATQPKHIAGFIDLVDILAYLVALCNSGLSQNASSLTSSFLSKPVGDLLDFSSRDHFTAVLEEDNLLKVVSLLAKEGVHRVAVIDILSDIRFLITQTDIIKAVCSNLESLMNVGRVTVRDLGVANSDVVTVLATDSALSSFVKMHANKLSAVPIIDPTTRVLIGTLSASDLKGVSSAVPLSAVAADTLSFSQQAQSSAGSLIPHAKAIVVTLDSTFEDVIRLAAQARVHRVWVVDTDHRPIGVISLTDICRIIVKLHNT